MTAQDLLRVQEAMMRTDAQYLGDWVETMADALIEIAAGNGPRKCNQASCGCDYFSDPITAEEWSSVAKDYCIAARALGIL